MFLSGEAFSNRMVSEWLAGFIAAIIDDRFSVSPSICSIRARCCFTKTDAIKV